MANGPNNDPIFISRPLHWDAELSSQVFSRAGGVVGGTSPVFLGASGNNGGVISSVSIETSGDCSANVCVLFTLRDGATVARKRCEVALPQVSYSSASDAIAPIRFTLPDREPFEVSVVELLKLGANESLYCALLQAETTSKFFVHAVGGLYDQA